MRKTKKGDMRRQLDRIDAKILRALQENGRISFVDLGEKVGLSTSPCLERVRRLEKAGYIRGYTAVLNPKLLDAALLVYVEIRLEYTTPDIFEQFSAAVRDLPQVLECHLVSGDFDFLLKIRIADMETYRNLLGEILHRLPGVRDSKSYVVMEDVKETLAVEVPDPVTE
ncbi:MAG: transcriptional regulator DadR [Gammaproteobacteria bacterium]